MISDGKTVWNFNRETQEVHITEHNPADMETMNPLALINNYERNFRAKLIREDRDNGIPVMIVDLNPLTVRSYHKIRVVSDKAKNTIVFSEIHEKNGTIFTFRVNRMQTNVSAPDRDFTFNASRHPGVEVIDLR
jgi:outer membrane lipoprotein-sorting protein